MPRLICLDGVKVWPLTPLAICWISPPDFRKAAICALIESLVSTAGAGLAFEWDALIRMAAIYLHKRNTASHRTGNPRSLLGESGSQKEGILASEQLFSVYRTAKRLFSLMKFITLFAGYPISCAPDRCIQLTSGEPRSRPESHLPARSVGALPRSANVGVKSGRMRPT